MDLEHLNKTQIILLTLLVSFVTSIATGIVTVSLLAQAPPAVTQTINRIVERTVEKVVPQTSGGVTTKETTVVVKEDDLITDSIEKNAKSTVRISRPVLLESGEVSPRVTGFGLIVSASGTIATDAAVLVGEGPYTATLSDGETYTLKPIPSSPSADIALASLVKEEEKALPVLSPIKIGDPEKARLGQSVVLLSGANRQNVSAGIVSSIIRTEPKTASSTRSVAYIDASIAEGTVLPGSPLINVFGEIVGISTADSRARGLSVFSASSVI